MVKAADVEGMVNQFGNCASNLVSLSLCLLEQI